MQTKIKISYCIGAYNEDKVIGRSVKTLTAELSKILGKDNFEIIIVENGSTENTYKVHNKLSSKKVNPIRISEKGHGAALKTAVLNAKFDNVAITAIDIPFG